MREYHSLAVITRCASMLIAQEIVMNQEVPDSFSDFLHFTSRDILFGISELAVIVTSIRLDAGSTSGQRAAVELCVGLWTADSLDGDKLT